MDGFAIVTQGFLGKPLRVTALLRPLGPCVPVAMKSHPFDPSPAADSLEFGGPMAGVEFAEFGKKGAIHRQRLEYSSHFVAKMNHRNSSGLLAGEADDPRCPVHILGREERHVRLRRAK